MNENGVVRKLKKKKKSKMHVCDSEDITRSKDNLKNLKKKHESLKHTKRIKSKHKEACDRTNYEIEKLSEIKIIQQDVSDEVEVPEKNRNKKRKKIVVISDDDHVILNEKEPKSGKKKKHSNKKKLTHHEDGPLMPEIGDLNTDENFEYSEDARLFVSLVVPKNVRTNISAVKDSNFTSKNNQSVVHNLPFLHDTPNPRKTQLSLIQIKNLRAKGMQVKTGKFSREEDRIIKKNLRKFRKKHNIDKANAYKLLGINYKSASPNTKKKTREFDRETNFIFKLGKGLEDRTIYSIYRRARTLFDPFKKIFKRREPLTEEQRNELFHLIELKGRNFSKISNIMNIPASKLIDEARKFSKKEITKGYFTEEENKKLVKAMSKVLKVSEDKVFQIYRDVDWEKVASRMPNRSAIQCRKHFTQAKIWKLAKGEPKEKFQQSDNLILLDLLRQSGVQNEEEIDWSSIAFEFKRKVSYCEIRKKWRELRATVPEDVSKYFDLEDYINYLEISMQMQDDKVENF